MFNKIIREPLFHFFLIGALVYMVYGLVNKDANTQENVIVITNGEIQWLEDNWEKTWNRAPSLEEREGLIKRQVRQKAMYKTAVEMGLDKDDIIIERRMVQKLEFLTSDILTPPNPLDGELEEFYNKNPKQYKTSSAITITQLYFDPDKREDKTLSDAENALVVLKKIGEPENSDNSLGDVFMLPSYFPMISDIELAKSFGNEFASQVFSLEPRSWYGPILSGYGTHLVYIHELKKAALPEFETVADDVKAEWQKKKLKELHDLYEEALIARYEIIIEGEDDTTGAE